MPTEPALSLSELFYSIQGESTYAGLPCVFIRLSGCNLRCHYCDARYTYQEPGKDYTLTEILAYADQYPGVMVEITGGEPLLQASVVPLMETLRRDRRTVLVETNGSLDISRIPQGVRTIIDVKCPGSGMSNSFEPKNLELLRPDDEIKFVLSSRSDYDWAVVFLNAHGLLRAMDGTTPHPLLFSPVPGQLDPAELAAWILHDRLPVRLQLQLHKILWPDISRGC